ncbi:ADT1-like protein [Mya arenaria]|uniref:ADT1-like protein n=1 Tax=Mya arenaria TaxID=6604 RepID=A0ABY7G7G0_MYAAR|nr:ADT1-like protein [Mya arenaria]
MFIHVHKRTVFGPRGACYFTLSLYMYISGRCVGRVKHVVSHYVYKCILADGAWAEWSSWSDCTKTCGDGIRFRARICLFDMNRPHGADSDGQWNQWGGWSQCTHTCNGGKQSRGRVCLYTPGFLHGAPCPGDSIAIQNCGTSECPVDGIWGPWYPWGTCSQSCDTGRTTRSRTCMFRTRDPATPHGKECDGDMTQLKDLDARWSTWSAFTTCDKTCGGGRRARTRHCIYDPVAPMGLNCTGSTEESEQCNTVECPVDGVLQSWKSWSHCTVTCEGGTHSRTRDCYFPLNRPHETYCFPLTPIFLLQSKATGPNGIHGQSVRSHAERDPSTESGTARIPTTPCTEKSVPGPSIRRGSVTHNTALWMENGPTGQPTVDVQCRVATAPTRGQGRATLTPVDGVFQDCGAWSVCPVTCGGGIQDRTRICFFPPDTPHGQDCGNYTHENQTCNNNKCPVDGVLTEWSEWSACTVTCGGGTMYHNRTCYFPPDVPHGLDCKRRLENTKTCNTNKCPVDGVWESWTAWTPCTVSCGNGTTTRDRNCFFPLDVPHGTDCTGDTSELRRRGMGLMDHVVRLFADMRWRKYDQDSELHLRPFSTEGTGVPRRCGREQPVQHPELPSNFTECTTTCGTGSQYRVRQCEFQPGYPHGENCTGPSNENSNCNENPCPVDGVWTAWVKWSVCSASCAGGTRNRSRTCDFPEPPIPHGSPCNGSAEAMENCNIEKCPIAGHWSNWSLPTDCSLSCGGGVQTRNRSCVFDDPDAPHLSECFGNTTETLDCNTQHCPVDGVWKAWNAWHQCSVTCGGGNRVRDRDCFFPPDIAQGESCAGQKTEIEQCNTNLCPVNGTFTAWSDWTSCSHTCGDGSQFRTRKCEFNGGPPGVNCTGNYSDSQTCNIAVCPVDGKWAAWEQWTYCTATCGTGSRSRNRTNRTCEYLPLGSPPGNPCPESDRDVKYCNTDPCPVNGDWGSWGEWTKCSATCNIGQHSRNRTCVYDPVAPKGAKCLGRDHMAGFCNDGYCPQDGVLSEWGTWSACSVTCGDGMESRDRSCVYPIPLAPHGKPCEGETNNTRACLNVTQCTVDGVWSEWSTYGACSVTCGNGDKIRTRTCDFTPGHPQGHNCVGNSTQSIGCTMRSCPVDGVWESWEAWDVCTRTCGTGTKVRTRDCFFPPRVTQGDFCTTGKSKETVDLDGTPGQWTEWTSCTVSCGGGTQTRTRNCTYPENSVHGEECKDSLSENRNCNSDVCRVDGVWSLWSAWGACSVTCADGTQLRTRSCTFPPDAAKGKDCGGNGNATQTCNLGGCPVDGFWGAWESWSACSVTCGNGQQTRDRNCTFPPDAVKGTECQGQPQDHQQCNDGPCTSKYTSTMCGTLEECHNGWFSKYSSTDKCLNFDEKFVYTSAFECEFCCGSDNCNLKVNPPNKYYPVP